MTNPLSPTDRLRIYGPLQSMEHASYPWRFLFVSVFFGIAVLVEVMG